MTCKICGTELLDGAKFCTNCGAKVEEGEIPVETTETAAAASNAQVNEEPKPEAGEQKVYAERIDGQVVDEGRHFDNTNQSYQNSQNTQNTQNVQSEPQINRTENASAEAPTGSNGFAIASLICGIVSLLCCCCSPIAIITAGVAVGLGIYVITSGLPGKEMAIAGIICGGIGLFIFLVSMIFSATGALRGLTDAFDISDIIESL